MPGQSSERPPAPEAPLGADLALTSPHDVLRVEDAGVDAGSAHQPVAAGAADQRLHEVKDARPATVPTALNAA